MSLAGSRGVAMAVTHPWWPLRLPLKLSVSAMLTTLFPPGEERGRTEGRCCPFAPQAAAAVLVVWNPLASNRLTVKKARSGFSHEIQTTMFCAPHQPRRRTWRPCGQAVADLFVTPACAASYPPPPPNSDIMIALHHHTAGRPRQPGAATGVALPGQSSPHLHDSGHWGQAHLTWEQCSRHTRPLMIVPLLLVSAGQGTQPGAAPPGAPHPAVAHSVLGLLYLMPESVCDHVEQ